MSEFFGFLDGSNQGAPEELSIEKICLNAEADLSSVLDFSDFVRVSAIYASSKYAERGLYRVLKERNPDSSRAEFLKAKVGQAQKVGRDFLGDGFGWFFRNYIVLLCVSLENFMRAHMLVYKLSEGSFFDLGRRGAVKSYLDRRQIKEIKESVHRWWEGQRKDRVHLLGELVQRAPDIYSNLLPQHVSYDWMNLERESLRKHKILAQRAMRRYEENLLIDDDLRVLSDLFPLRNAIVHNGSVSQEQLTFNDRIIGSREFISLSAEDVNFFVRKIRKYKNYFPAHSEY